MRVQYLNISGLSVHRATEVMLPSNGLVLVHGPNGGGKSTLLEAVSACIWGEGLRGGKPRWNPEVKQAFVGLRTVDGMFITRSKAVKTGLTFARSGEDAVKFDTATKAQEALDRLVGTSDVWRRTSVFRSADLSSFTQSTDAERKRLLESILGLERFDAALEACRVDLAAAQNKAQRAENALRLAQERLRGDRARLSDARDRLKDLRDRAAEASVAATPDLEQRIATLRKEIDVASESATASSRRVAEIETELMALERRYKVLSASQCDRCGQSIEARHAHPLLEGLRTERAGLTDALTLVQQDGQAATARGRRLAAKYEALRDERAKVRAAEASVRSRDAELATLTAAEHNLLGAVEDDLDQIDALTAEGAEARESLGLLSAADKVLNLTGVRAHLLEGALQGIESIANTWLGRLAGRNMTVELRPYGEKVGGGIKNAIALKVLGGLPYHDASDGERRRIDLAMVLALAEVAEAASGCPAGTLWFDEVMDALDDEGVSAVVEVLTDLVRDRCVVLISHNRGLMTRLGSIATQTLRVEGGVVQPE